MSTSNPPPRSDGQRRSATVLPFDRTENGVACSCDVALERGPAGDIVVLRIYGAIDFGTIRVVETALIDTLCRPPADLVVDLSGATFCSAGGFALLAIFARAAEAVGTVFSVSGLRPHLDRVATLLWPRRHCVRYRSAAAAVSAIRVDQTYRVVLTP